MYQKAYSFVDSFICYKQKCKVVSFNLSHPVDLLHLTCSVHNCVGKEHGFSFA